MLTYVVKFQYLPSQVPTQLNPTSFLNDPFLPVYMHLCVCKSNSKIVNAKKQNALWKQKEEDRMKSLKSERYSQNWKVIFRF